MFVESLVLEDDLTPVEVTHTLSAALAERLSQRLVAEQSVELEGERGGIRRVDEDGVEAVPDELRYPAVGAGENGTGRSPGFEHDDPERLDSRWDDDELSGPDEAPDLRPVNPTCEVDPLLHGELGDEVPQPRDGRAVPSDDEAVWVAIRDVGERPDGQIEPLVPYGPSEPEDVGLVGDDGISGLVDVDAVEDDPALLGTWLRIAAPRRRGCTGSRR